MNHFASPLPGVIVVEPVAFADARGHFLETFHAERYAAAGIPTMFVQDNTSTSVRGTLRGLHHQLTRPQGKLVWVTRGEVFDVAVDIRVDSPTFRQWFGITLSAANHRQVYIPPGFAHGFVALSEEADVSYKCTAFYERADERTIRWDDPALAIAWPVEAPLLSARDAVAPLLAASELPRCAS